MGAFCLGISPYHPEGHKEMPEIGQCKTCGLKFMTDTKPRAGYIDEYKLGYCQHCYIAKLEADNADLRERLRLGLYHKVHKHVPHKPKTD